MNFSAVGCDPKIPCVEEDMAELIIEEGRSWSDFRLWIMELTFSL